MGLGLTSEEGGGKGKGSQVASPNVCLATLRFTPTCDPSPSRGLSMQPQRFKGKNRRKKRERVYRSFCAG